MRKLMMRNPRSLVSNFADFINEDWGWFDYPGNELDMYEEDDNLVINLKAPGFKEDEVDITIESGTVTITGKAEKRKEEEDKDRKYFRREIQAKSFTRRVDLPFAVDAKEAEADFEDGVLRLTLPKSEEAKPKSVKISPK